MDAFEDETMNEPNADQVATGVTQAAAAPTTSAAASVLDRIEADLAKFDRVPHFIRTWLRSEFAALRKAL